MIDIQEISPESIDWSSPNIRSIIDETGALAASIEAHGQLEPGTGWWEGNQFRLATGHRRANACRHLGIAFLARIIPPLSGTDLVEFQLVENIQAEALLPEDLERGVAILVKEHGNQEKVGERLGKSAQWVSTIVGAGTVRKSLLRSANNEEDNSEGSNQNSPLAVTDSESENSAPATEPEGMTDGTEAPEKGETAAAHSLSTTAAAQFGRLKNEENRKAAFEEALRRNKNNPALPGRLVRDVVEEYMDNEIRDVQAYIWKLQQERVKLVRKRADIEAEIDRIDTKITRLQNRSYNGSE